MKHLEKMRLKTVEEAFHKFRIIEMEGVFPAVTLEEIPVQQSPTTGPEAVMKVPQLRGRIG